MATASRRHTGFLRRLFIEPLEDRRLLASVTLNPAITYQTIQGFGTAAVYPTDLVTVAQAGAIMRDAGMNVVRVTPSAYDYTYTVGGSMTTPVPISANLDENVARFYPDGNNQTDLINWLQVNGLEPDRVKMIGALWSPPHWMKITTGRLMTWYDNGIQKSAYDPIIPWGDYGHNTGAGRVNPDMWTDWARYVLSTIKSWEQKTGLPMYAFSFQNEPNVPAVYNSATFAYIANNVNNPSAGFTDGHWELYGDAVQALANELAFHPEITTMFFGPELSQLGGGASNPYNLPSYNAVRQNLINRGLLDDLGGWATHQYTYAREDDAALWDAWYNGSAHAALILSNGTSNVLGWLWPQPGVAGDNKEIWQTETDGEDQTWTKDGAMSFGLKIQNALVYGHVSGYTSWTLTGYSSSDTWGLVDLDDINNPTNSYKYDAMKQFSRYISSGAERIEAVFENGKACIGGANELDTYNGLTVSSYYHPEDQRLTTVFVNMKSSSEPTTITIPAGLDIASFQVFQTSSTQKYAQLANLIPSGGQISLPIPAYSIVTITGIGNYEPPGLPAGWNSSNVGNPAIAGSSSESNGTFTIQGAGNDIWNNADQFQFAYMALTGDGTITARVVGVGITDAWAKAGVMFRNTLDAGSIHTFMAITPGNGAAFQYRSSSNGSSSNTNVTGYSAPYWVRITRSGNNFTGYRSSNGVTWTQVGSTVTLNNMNSTVYVGLAVTSHNPGALCTSVFDNVTVTSPDTTPPTVTINQAASQADPANASPINFTVVFSESVTDFATGDVTLNGTAGATSAIVSGGGTTYNVAVSGMTADGTVIASLLAGVAHDAAGNPCLASTSTDNTVTFSTPTHTWDGGSAVDSNWSTAANWEGDIAPLSGDNLVFPAGAARLENFNDYPAGAVFGSVTVSGGGYKFTNAGIMIPASIEVQPGIQLEADAIVTGTLTIGVGAIITITPLSGGPLAAPDRLTPAATSGLSTIADAVESRPASEVPQVEEVQTLPDLQQVLKEPNTQQVAISSLLSASTLSDADLSLPLSGSTSGPPVVALASRLEDIVIADANTTQPETAAQAIAFKSLVNRSPAQPTYLSFGVLALADVLEVRLNNPLFAPQTRGKSAVSALSLLDDPLRLQKNSFDIKIIQSVKNRLFHAATVERLFEEQGQDFVFDASQPVFARKHMRHVEKAVDRVLEGEDENFLIIL